VSRLDIARFLDVLSLIYIVMVLAYIVMSMLPIPYNRFTVAVREFLDQTVGPPLRFLRRYVPMFGPFDFSPMLLILGIQILVRSILIDGIILG